MFNNRNSSLYWQNPNKFRGKRATVGAKVREKCRVSSCTHLFIAVLTLLFSLVGARQIVLAQGYQLGAQDGIHARIAEWLDELRSPIDGQYIYWRQGG